MKYNKQVLERASNIIISLGSGSGATEMTGDLPCLCLDNDRRAIYSAIINLKGNLIGKKQFTYHSVFDIRNSDDLFIILNTIKTKLPNHTLKILFQHPSPSTSLDDTYNKCGIVCMKALNEKIILEVHFVYDTREGANCLNRKDIIDKFEL